MIQRFHDSVIYNNRLIRNHSITQSLNIVSLGIGCINLKSVYADTTGTETSIVLSDDGTTVNGKKIYGKWSKITKVV